MNALTGLKLVASKKNRTLSPVAHRRNKLVNKLHEQIELARCQADGKTYAPSRLRSIKDKHTGERKLIDSVKRVKQWWFVAENGRVCLQVRYGTRVLELAKGKNSIDVGTVADLLPVLETVKRCVEAGELDAQIDAASAAVRARFTK